MSAEYTRSLTINNSSVSKSKSCSCLRQIVRDVGHGLHASGENNIAVTSHDAEGGRHDRFHAGRTYLVDGGAWRVQGQRGAKDSLSGGGLANTSLKDRMIIKCALLGCIMCMLIWLP